MDKSKEQIKFYISKLLQHGFKKHELEIKTGYGVYFITLPHTAYSVRDMGYIMEFLRPNEVIGIFPAINKGSLAIKTDIKVK